MKLTYLIQTILLLTTINVFSQVPDTLWTKTYGDTLFNSNNSFEQTSDGGLIICGYTYDAQNDGDKNVWLIKTDSLGDTLWSKVYGGDNDDEAFSVKQTSDQGFIICGRTDSYGAGFFDVLLIKIDSLGDTLWTKTYGGDGDDEAYSVQELENGRIIIGARTFSYGEGLDDIWIICTDNFGDSLWTRTYGGRGMDNVRSIIKMSDGGFAFCGGSSSFEGYFNAYVLRTDKLGDTLWTKSIGGDDFDCANSIQQTRDKGFIICGETESFDAIDRDAWLIKTDSVGDTLWTKTFGGENSEYAYDVEEMSDGGFILCGHTRSISIGKTDIWIIKTDSLGDTLWTKTFGGANSEFAWDLHLTNDEDIIICGNSNSFGTGLADCDAWIIKLDSDGTPISLPNSFVNSDFNLNHILTNSSVNISYNLLKPLMVNLSIFNAQGRLIKTLINSQLPAMKYNVSWDIKDIGSGVYYYKLEAGDEIVSRQVVVRR